MIKYDNISVIGCGRVGGFLAKSLSESNEIGSISLIDNDIVNERNVNDSIYSKDDIGMLKVESLKRLIKKTNSKVEVIPRNIKINDFNKLMHRNNSLSIDCRDFVYDRRNSDVRIYAPSYYLVLDCSKSRYYNRKYEGKCINTNTNEIENGCNNISKIILDKSLLNKLLKNEITQEVDPKLIIDDFTKTLYNTLERSFNNDIIYDNSKYPLINFNIYYKDILKINKNREIFIYKDSFYYKKNIKSVHVKIEKNSLNSMNDIQNVLDKFISYYPIKMYNEYLITLVDNNIIIITNSGGA